MEIAWFPFHCRAFSRYITNHRISLSLFFPFFFLYNLSFTLPFKFSIPSLSQILHKPPLPFPKLSVTRKKERKKSECKFCSCLEMLVVGLFLILLCCSDCLRLVSSLNDEGFVLLSLKQSISEDPDGALSNWDSSDETPCSWNGIGCTEEIVVSVSFPKKNLYGFLPSNLGALSGLRHVNLRNNRLFGSLPFQLFSPQGLQSLVLYGNSFSGSVPNGIGKLKFLQTLDLSQNFFNGSLPTSIIQCKRLKTLDVSRNNFTGSLPHGFGTSLSSLEKLDLSFNSFDGSLPSDLGNLSSLQGTFDLSHNLFSGSIPASLGNLPEKVYIDLSHNNLSGPIPQNGSLINKGPTAFLGNPGLCGSPLKNTCSSEALNASSPSLLPFLPDDHSPGISADNAEKARGLSKSAVIAIVLGDVIGICLVGLLFSYCYSRVCTPRKSKDETGHSSNKGKGRNECLCFRKDESETVSQNVEQYDLVPLDAQVEFDLDELLKASAFVLGKSGIGIVYKVVLEDGVSLAVRRLGEGGSQRFKEFQTEVEAIAKLRHPNLVTLRAYYWSVDEKLLVYDFIPKGNLATAIHGKSGMVAFTPISWSARLMIMEGIAKGMVYLHEFSPKKYVHGDLKPNNILLSQNMEAKISDFGLARLAIIAGGTPTLQSSRVASEKPLDPKQLKTVTSDICSSSSNTGTCYQAPESLKVLKPSQKWDVYSYGVILLEMITGRFPLIQVSSSSEMDLVHWIQLCIEEQKPLSEVIDPYLVQDADKEEEIISVLKIAMACVHGSPERRPSMRHISDALERVSSASRN